MQSALVGFLVVALMSAGCRPKASQASASSAHPHGSQRLAVAEAAPLPGSTPAGSRPSVAGPQRAGRAHTTLPDAAQSRDGAPVPPTRPTPTELHVWVRLDYTWISSLTLPGSIPPTDLDPWRPPLENRRHIPVQPFGLRGATLATEGHSIAILRDQELQQDGLYSGHALSKTFKEGRFLGLAGSWPSHAFALFEQHDDLGKPIELQLLEWRNHAWTKRQTLESTRALLMGNQHGATVLAESFESGNRQGVTLRDADGQTYRPTSAKSECMTELVEPRSLKVASQGTVLLQGSRCGRPQEPLFELWRSPREASQILAAPVSDLQASELDPSGRPWIAGRRDGTGGVAILRWDGQTWSEHSAVDVNTVASLAVDAAGTLWIVGQKAGEAARLLRHRSGNDWEMVHLPSEAGEPRRVTVENGRLWLGTERALLSTDKPSSIWDWQDIGTVYPLSHAARRGKGRHATCTGPMVTGGRFVVVYDRAQTPNLARWASVFEAARQRKQWGLGARSNAPVSGADPKTVPILAREGDSYWFGFLVHDPHLVEQMTNPFPAAGSPPIAYCANPVSLSMRGIAELLRPFAGGAEPSAQRPTAE